MGSGLAGGPLTGGPSTSQNPTFTTATATTFTSPPGTTATLVSNLGTAPAAIVTRAGTSQTNVATNATAHLFSVQTGIPVGTGANGDAEVAYFTKDGTLRNTSGKFMGASTVGYVLCDDGTGVQMNFSGTSITVGVSITASSNGSIFLAATNDAALRSNVGQANAYSQLGAGATDVCARLGSGQSSVAASSVLGGFATGIGGTPVDIALVRGSGRIDQSGTDSTGTPGNATIDKPTGKSTVANAASSVVITNALVTAASRIIITLHADPGTTAARWWVVPAAGSFTLTFSGAVGQAIPFSWQIATIL